MATVQAIFLLGFLCAIASRLEYYMAPQYREWHASEYDAGWMSISLRQLARFAFLSRHVQEHLAKPQPVMAHGACISAG